MGLSLPDFLLPDYQAIFLTFSIVLLQEDVSFGELPLDYRDLDRATHVFPTLPHGPPSLRGNIGGYTNLPLLLTGCVILDKLFDLPVP